MKWERAFFTIKLRKPPPFGGPQSESWEGLVNEQGTFALYVRDRFVEVTHVPSGKRIADATSLAAADRMVEQLHGMEVDWSQPDLGFSDVEMVMVYSLIKRA